MDFDIEAGRQRILTTFKKKKLLEDGRTPIEKYIDIYWRKEIILKKLDKDSDATRKINKVV